MKTEGNEQEARNVGQDSHLQVQEQVEARCLRLTLGYPSST